MKRNILMRNPIIGFLLSLALSSAAFGQTVLVPQVQQNAQMLNAATLSSSTAPAVNATQAAGTLTITPPSGQYVYFTGIYVAACGDGTASITSVQQNFTTTNLNSLTIETSWISGSTITTAPGASLCDRVTLPFATPLKSAAAGTAVTIVPPAQAAHLSFPIVVTYYFSP
jgi:hypothetical protein